VATGSTIGARDLGQSIRSQAAIMGYADCFGLIGAMLSLAVLSVLFPEERGGRRRRGALNWSEMMDVSYTVHIKH
jgi:hypothetical protein